MLKIKSGDTARVVALAVLLSVALATPAYAQSNVNNMAQSVLNLVTGTLAKIVAALSFAWVGYRFWIGRASIEALMSTVAGCFLVFSGPWLVSLITG